MKTKTLIIVLCIMTMTMLTGCFGGGGGGGSASGGSSSGGIDVAGLPGGSIGGDSILGGSGDSGIPHNPEPATLALLGGGLAAYALLKHNKRKKR